MGSNPGYNFKMFSNLLLHIFLVQDIDVPQSELTNVLVMRLVLNVMPLEMVFNSHVINLVICAHCAKYFTSNQGVIIVTKVSVCARIIAKSEKSSVVNVKSIVDISNTSLANKLFQMFLRYVHSYFQVYLGSRHICTRYSSRVC